MLVTYAFLEGLVFGSAVQWLAALPLEPEAVSLIPAMSLIRHARYRKGLQSLGQDVKPWSTVHCACRKELGEFPRYNEPVNTVHSVCPLVTTSGRLALQ